MDKERLDCIETRLEKIEEKLDGIADLVALGKHLAAFARFLAWCGGAYIAVETYIRQVLHAK
jgi:hypothetical protein